VNRYVSDARISRMRVGDEDLIVVSVPCGVPASVDLTDAERDVVALALRGDSNAEIAQARGTSARTVANQLASAYRKLGVTGRNQLAALGRRGGGDEPHDADLDRNSRNGLRRAG
jgi:DNA-binding CsgD family transcriptional regulator